jgi:hypothetical protein
MGIVANKRNRSKFFTGLVGTVAFTLAASIASHAQTLADALDTTNLVWTTGGDAAWFAETTNTYDGVDAAQSGPVYSNQTSWIETTVVGPATISFWFVTEPYNQLSWRFGINDPNPPFLANRVPGPGNWYQQIYDLGEGTNVLRWTIYGLTTNSAAGFFGLDEFTVSPPRPLAFASYQPTDQTIYSDANLSLGVLAIGTPPIHYQWSKDGTNIADATNAWFVLNQATTNDSGIYFVTVSNSQDQIVSSNAVVTVLPPTAPFFTPEPANTTAYTGQYFQWYANVSGSPSFTYAWWKGGTLIQTGTNGAYGSGYSSVSLILYSVSESDAGNYWLTVTNDYGGVQSSNVTLTVIPSVAPVITRQPRSLEVAEGVNTWMSMAATGVPEPYYTWTGPDSPPASPLFPIPSPGLPGSNSKHTFINTSTNDAGIYFATVSNYAGETNSWSALLTVLPAITNTGSWDGDALDIFITNNLAFLARGTNGLAILDVSNSASPQLLGSFSNNVYASKVVVSDGVAYVATGSAGLEILSVTNPANPVLLDTFVTPGSANDVVVRSNLAYVADGRAGLLILDVSNAAAPSVVGSYKTNYLAFHICLSGNHAILSSPSSDVFPGTNVAGLFVVNASDPAHPNETGRLSTPVGNLDAHNQCVFGIALNGLNAISITNPAQPKVIGTFNTYYSTNGFPLTGIYATDIRVMADRALVTANSGSQSQLFVLDAQDPTELIPVGYYTNSGQFSTLVVNGNRVYLAGNQTPLQIVQTPFDTNPIAPPALLASAQAGINLQIHGHPGWHYDVEYTPQLNVVPWQTLETVLITNDTATISVPSSSMTGFFRLKQSD